LHWYWKSARLARKFTTPARIVGISSQSTLAMCMPEETAQRERSSIGTAYGAAR